MVCLDMTGDAGGLGSISVGVRVMAAAAPERVARRALAGAGSQPFGVTGDFQFLMGGVADEVGCVVGQAGSRAKIAETNARANHATHAR